MISFVGRVERYGGKKSNGIYQNLNLFARNCVQIIKQAACLSERLGIISGFSGGFMTLCVCVKYVLRGLV